MKTKEPVKYCFIYLMFSICSSQRIKIKKLLELYEMCLLILFDELVNVKIANFITNLKSLLNPNDV